MRWGVARSQPWGAHCRRFCRLSGHTRALLTTSGSLGPMAHLEVLGHQGGWDEIVLVAGPLVLLWLLLVFANRRAKRLRDSNGDRVSRE